MRRVLHPTGHFANEARPYQHIRALPLAAAMGAEITGVHLGQLTDAQFAEIRDALFHHKMIFFRGQKLTHAEHEAFSLRFGPFAEDAYMAATRCSPISIWRGRPSPPREKNSTVI